MKTKETSGMFITFEGIDGCGKTTQLKAVAEWLPTSGLLPEGTEVVTTREPGCIPGIRQLLKDPDTVITARAELLLLMADRAQHVETLIRPELEKGNWVLCDRFYASTMAYQGWGRALGWQAVMQAHELASGLLYPDLELFFDVPADEALARLKRREGSEFAGDRFELQGRPFVDRLVDGFDTCNKLPFLKEYPHTTIDGCRELKEVTAECIQKVSMLGRRPWSQP
jgi:dTMP kinase